MRVNLPHYAGDSTFHPTMGYSFDSLVTLLASTLEASLSSTSETSALLLVHDWGAFYGMQLQRRYPQLVRKMVVLDVAWIGYEALPLSKSVPALFAMVRAWLVAK